ncbi:saccharopine dehydrogenase NADP-binding domain-containing protein [Actinoplanes sp. N902-109]|uniref:saccharopine dehydrogenase NADP-binding domain-containing protein n=1 Tax=Actinoplanes sp. (strain N902-109) TaxID=649831 RepID=UPI0003294047|nr:saccharopine dehydrogenase NADP-binding domain-containing protein [Actinoplanes sp. N902-109]AGL19065.1 Saccharopine dehydrogenase [Actinoplanes sp. N902-109]
MTGEIWVLGASGRIGRAVAARLRANDANVVLVGRNPDALPGKAVVIADGAGQMAARIAERRPAVVVNTMGGYAGTAVPLARACLPAGHYLDLAADLTAIPALLALHDEAAAAGRTLITGAGFGVLAGEAVVVELCRDRPRPARVRVDALSSVALEAGSMGEAFAASIVDVITTGGRQYRNGMLVKAALGGDVRTHALPDGQTVRSASAPSGELVAAQRASGAPDVTVTTALAPTAPGARLALPALAALLSVPAVRRFAVRRLARVTMKATPRPRTHSWGHAVVTWPDGSSREGWLRTGDGMDFTADVATETALRLARGEAPPGAYTPAQAFGTDLATAAGAVLLT